MQRVFGEFDAIPDLLERTIPLKRSPILAVTFSAMLMAMTARLVGASAGESCGGSEGVAPLHRCNDKPLATWGKQWRYHISWGNTSRSYLRGFLPGGAERQPNASTPSPVSVDSFSLDVDAMMTVIVDAQFSDSSRIFASFDDIALTFKAQGFPNDTLSRSLVEDMGIPVLVTLDKSGAILRVQIVKASSQNFPNLIRGLASLLQFQLPPGGTGCGDVWESVEFSPSGRYVAHYRIEPMKGEIVREPKKSKVVSVRKTRTDFRRAPRSPICGSLLLGMKTRNTGDMVATVDTAARIIESLSGTVAEEVRIGRMTATTSESRLNAKLVSVTSVEESSANRNRFREFLSHPNITSYSLYEEPKAPSALTLAESSYQPTLDESTLFRFCDSLQTTRDSTLSALVVLEAKALAQRDPTLCRRIGAYLCRPNVSTRLLSTLSAVLAALSSQEAQDALVAMLQCHTDGWARKTALVMALARVRNPSSATEAALWGLAESEDDGIRRVGEEVLAILAHCLPDSAAGRQRAIAAALALRLDSATSEERKCHLLTMLGNTRGNQALVAIDRYLRDSSQTIRLACTSALRWVESTRADTILAMLMLNDSSGEVRMGAIESVLWREPEAVVVRTAMAVAARDPDEAVRLDILKYLSKVRRDYSDVEQILTQVADHDPAERVRSTARSLLMAP